MKTIYFYIFVYSYFLFTISIILDSKCMRNNVLFIIYILKETQHIYCTRLKFLIKTCFR